MKYVDTKKAPAAIGPYSQAIKSHGFVFTSGQIPLDPATGTIKGTTIEEQAEQVFLNVIEILKEAGTSSEKIVKTTCFLKNIQDFAAFNAVYEKFITNKPARSCFEVVALPKNALVEVEVIAEE